MTAELLHYSEDEPVPDRYMPPAAGEMQALEDLLARSVLSGGAKVVAEYEAALAAYFGTRHAVAVNSGSSALHAVLHVLGARTGTEVMVPAPAPLPSAMPILTTGATPVIVDVVPGGLGLDPADVARKLTSRTVAALSVPLWGHPAEVAEPQRVLSDAGIPVVEDAAQAHGTRIAGRYAGTLGVAGCFSTHDRKLLSTGEGGFILTDDDELADKVDTFTHLGHLTGKRHGVNYKLAAPLAAIGLQRLPALDDQIRWRTSNTKAVLAALPPGGPIRELQLPRDSAANYYALVLHAERNVDLITRRLTARGLPPDTARWRYQGLHRSSLFARWATACPNADELISSVFQIPAHPGLSSAALRYIASTVQEAATEQRDHR